MQDRERNLKQNYGTYLIRVENMFLVVVTNTSLSFYHIKMTRSVYDFRFLLKRRLLKKNVPYNGKH